MVKGSEKPSSTNSYMSGKGFLGADDVMDSRSPRCEEMPHNQLLEEAEKLLALLLDDPFLSDVRADWTVEDIECELALAQGKAITVHIHKFDGEGVTSVIVKQGVTVNELMKAFERKQQKICIEQKKTVHLNWRYIWKTYCLVCGHSILKDRQAKLTSYGVGNQATLHFVKNLKEK